MHIVGTQTYTLKSYVSVVQYTTQTYTLKSYVQVVQYTQIYNPACPDLMFRKSTTFNIGFWVWLPSTAFHPLPKKIFLGCFFNYYMWIPHSQNI